MRMLLALDPIRAPAISLDPKCAAGFVIGGHSVDPARELVAANQQSFRRRCREQNRHFFNRDVVLSQTGRLRLRHRSSSWRQRRRTASLLRVAHLASPPLLCRLAELSAGLPLPEALRKVLGHAPFDLGQYVPHQAVSPGAFAIAGISYDADP